MTEDEAVAAMDRLHGCSPALADLKVLVVAAFEVGWTSHRPVRPDEHTSYVVVSAESDNAAALLAAQIVAVDPRCVMPTSTRMVV